MLASFEHVVPVHPLTWKLTTIETSGFESAWHFHTEFELTYWIRPSRASARHSFRTGQP